jgi:hypothetical protein
MPTNSTNRLSVGKEKPPVRGSDPHVIAESQTWASQRSHDQATRAALARRASVRRRFTDPTTCERDYTEAELQFMQAMQDYKQRSGRMFPTWSEVLEVLKNLGYQKVAMTS